MTLSPFLTLRVGIVLTAFGTVFAQILVIPLVADDQAAMWPEVGYLRWPYTAAALAAVVCVQVALVAIWALLGKVEHDEVFDDRSFGWVDLIIGAAVAATVLSAGMAAHLLFVERVGGPGVILGLAAVLVGGSTFALLMTVMRGLLRTATTMRGDLAEIV